MANGDVTWNTPVERRLVLLPRQNQAGLMLGFELMTYGSEIECAIYALHHSAPGGSS